MHTTQLELFGDGIVPGRQGEGLQYFLGAHRPHWLAVSDQPLFVSHRTLRARKSLPRARAAWALDSGGFTELSLHGAWRTSPAEYVRAVSRYSDEVGALAFAAQQDFMCEPEIVAKTGLSVARHQELTVDNYLELMTRAPHLPWLPVVQGWTVGDYEDHVELWARRGIDLTRVKRVGVGTICRRKCSIRLRQILQTVANCGLRIHAFGLKTAGLHVAGGLLDSADSLAWSYAARRENREDEWRLVGRRTGKQNRLEAALDWFDAHIRPILETGFCHSSGHSLRYLDGSSQPAAAGATP